MRRAEAVAVAAAVTVLLVVGLVSTRNDDVAWSAPLSADERTSLGMIEWNSAAVNSGVSSPSPTSQLRANVQNTATQRNPREPQQWEHALDVMLGNDPGKVATLVNQATRAQSEKPTSPLSQGDEDPALTGAERFIGDGWTREIFLTSHGGNFKKPNPGNDVQVYRYQVQQPHLHHWNQAGLAIDLDKSSSLGMQNLRGMATVGNALFVASAHSSRSKIVLAHKCNRSDSDAKTFAVDGLDHPYGIGFYQGALYASNQNTDQVVRFWVADGLGAKAHPFAEVKNPRGLAIDRKGRVWVASTKKGLFIFDANKDGKLIKNIDITHAVGVAIDHDGTGVIYVGSVDGKNSGIYAISPSTLEPIKKLTVPKPHKLTHPAGLAIVDDRLLVVEQDEEVLYSFCTRTGTFKGAVLTNLPERPEQISVLKCK